MFRNIALAGCLLLSSSTFVSSSSRKRDSQYDIVVVGGGIVGTSVATFAKFLQPQKSILLIDSEAIGAGASSHSAGTVWLPQLLSKTHLFISDSIQSILTKSIHDYESCLHISPNWEEILSSKTVDIYRMIEAAGLDCELVESGALLVAGSQKESEYVEDMFNDLLKRGYVSNKGIEFVKDSKRLHELEPLLKFRNDEGGVHSVLHLPASVHIDPIKTTQAISKIGETLGVQFILGDPVIKFELLKKNEEEEDLFLITLESGDQLMTRKIVLAAGATVSKIFPERGNVIVPVKGQIVQTNDPIKSGLKKIIFSAAAHTAFASGIANSKNYKTPGECTHDSKGNYLTRHLYGRQKKDGHVIFGGGRIPYPDYLHSDGLNYNIDTEVMNGVRVHVNEIINSQELVEGLQNDTWACFMPFSLDGRPFLGELKDIPGLYLAIGFGPEGMSWGPGAGLFLASEIFEIELDPRTKLVKEALNPNGRI